MITVKIKEDKKTIIEWNKLIAEIDGWNFLPNGNCWHERFNDHGQQIEMIPSILSQYHTSWDCLMPVLIEIERIIVGEVTWISTYCDIEREYKRAVEWIKKYNDNPKHMTLQ